MRAIVLTLEGLAVQVTDWIAVETVVVALVPPVGVTESFGKRVMEQSAAGRETLFFPVPLVATAWAVFVPSAFFGVDLG